MEDCISEREYIQISMVGHLICRPLSYGNRIYITAIIKTFYHIRPASRSLSLWCKAEDSCDGAPHYSRNDVVRSGDISDRLGASRVRRHLDYEAATLGLSIGSCPSRDANQHDCVWPWCKTNRVTAVDCLGEQIGRAHV